MELGSNRGNKWQNYFTQALLDSRGTALRVQDHVIPKNNLCGLRPASGKGLQVQFEDPTVQGGNFTL